MLGAPARLDELKDVADRRDPVDRGLRAGVRRDLPGVGGIGAAGVYSFNEYKTIPAGTAA